MVFVSQVSRLGKYVNWIRKQTKDKGLARRIKQLLKQWQKLANSATTQNGLQQKIRDTPTSVQRPVSPANSILPSVSSASVSSASPSTSILSTASLHSTPIADGVGSTGGSKSDAVSNRLKIRSLFSAIKKSESPQPNLITPLPPTTTATDSTSIGNSKTLFSSTSAPHFTSASFSQPILPPPRTSSPLPSLLIEDITPVEPTDANKRQLSPHTNVDRNGLGPPLPTLIANSQPLLVRFPASHQKSDERELEAEQVVENTFIVSIPRHLIILNVARPVSPDLPQPLLVSISRKYYDSLPSNNRLHPMAINDKALPKFPTPTSPSPVDLSLSCAPSIGAPPGRLKQTIVGVPMGCSLGVDGCLGANGVWYDWTEYIPGTHEEMVTVLPYVYIDGCEQSP